MQENHAFPNPRERKPGGCRPPGPPWYTAAQNTLRLTRDPLSFFVQMRECYGDLVSIPTLQGRFYAAFHPDYVRSILQENQRNYNKEMAVNQVLRLLLESGLLTNDGDAWLRQRRLIQPAFHRERIVAFGTLMTEATLAWTRRWETDGFIDTSKPLDLTQEMSGLTLRIVSQALFGTDLSKEIMRVGRALTTANRLLAAAFYLPWMLLLVMNCIWLLRRSFASDGVIRKSTGISSRCSWKRATRRRARG